MTVMQIQRSKKSSSQKEDSLCRTTYTGISGVTPFSIQLKCVMNNTETI